MPESKRSVSAGVAAALPPVITACGAILAAVSEPPGMRRQK